MNIVMIIAVSLYITIFGVYIVISGVRDYLNKYTSCKIIVKRIYENAKQFPDYYYFTVELTEKNCKTKEIEVSHVVYNRYEVGDFITVKV